MRNTSCNLTGRGDPEMIVGMRASAGFFAALGVAPGLARIYAFEEDRPGCQYEVVLSNSLSRDLSPATGTFSGAEGAVLVIRRIHVRLILKTAEENHEVATRVHGVFADRCPVYLTLKPAITMTTELVLENFRESTLPQRVS